MTLAVFFRLLNVKFMFIETMLLYIAGKEIQMGKLGQDILDAVTAQTTSVDSLITLIQGWVTNGTVTPDQGTAILTAINDQKAKIDAALIANVLPADPA